MPIKDMRSQWWLLTEHHHQIKFYGNGAQPTDHSVGNSTDVVAAQLATEGLFLTTRTGSVYLVDWNRHRVNLANLIMDRVFLGTLGVVFPGDNLE